MTKHYLPKEKIFSGSFECGCVHEIYADKKGGSATFCKKHLPKLLGERLEFWKEKSKIEIIDELEKIAHEPLQCRVIANGLKITCGEKINERT